MMKYTTIAIDKDHRLDVFRLRDGRPACFAKVITNGNRISAINAKGEFFTNYAFQRGFYINWRGSPVYSRIVEDAVALGVLPKKLVEEIKAAIDDRRKIEQLGYASNNLLQVAEDAGIKLTSHQAAHIQRQIDAKRRLEKASRP